MDLSHQTASSGTINRGGSWWISLGIGALLLVVYLSNRREIGSYDTEPTTLTALTLVRGEGIYLDRFSPVLWESDGRRPPYVGRSGNHIVSLYPLATAILAAPLVAPQVWLLDRLRPGWDDNPARAWSTARSMAKRAAAMLVAILGVLLHRVTRHHGPAWAAVAATLVACLGSDLWIVGSQALWQHGPAALMLVVVLWLFAPAECGPWRTALAGAATGFLVACRAIDLVFAVVILGWVALLRRDRLVWFLPAPLLIAVALLAYNLETFGAISGGQARLESIHPRIHGVPGPWSGPLWEGMTGTLLSPARGLFVYCPWVLISLALAPRTLRRLPRNDLAAWLIAGLVPYLLLLSQYSVWWAGHTFGPRYWTDATPLFAVLLTLALAWSLEHRRAWLPVLGAAAVWSVALQAIAAWCYPSSWNLSPRNVDRAHERLWDWHDTEVRRAITESLQPRSTSSP